MIKHIVLLKFYEEAGGMSKEENIARLKQALDELPEKIDMVLDFETGVNVTNSGNAYDLALQCTFVSQDELEEYRNHPDHNAVLGLLNLVVENKVFVDYEY